MSCDQIEEIERIVNKHPEAFVHTTSCLNRRQNILRDVERQCNDHDSLVLEYKTNYIRVLENCDYMLERVFHNELSKSSIHIEFVVPTRISV